MTLFQDLLKAHPNRYIGYGNPASTICIIGKEPSDKCIMPECVIGTTSMWDGILPMFVNRHKDELNEDRIWHTGHTWMKYQKLFNAIYPELDPGDGAMNFEQHLFVTEMNELPSKHTDDARKDKTLRLRLQERKESFFTHPYFKQFKVIVLACSDYIINDNKTREIDRIFDVTYDNGEHLIGSNGNSFWTHHNFDRTRLVIHTRQLSCDVSDKLLEEMGKIIRKHLDEVSNCNCMNINSQTIKNTTI